MMTKPAFFHREFLVPYEKSRRLIILIRTVLQNPGRTEDILVFTIKISKEEIRYPDWYGNVIEGVI